MLSNRKRMILISHTTGNPNSRQTMDVIASEGWLNEAHTSLSWNPRHWLAKCLPNVVVRHMSRRQFPASVQPWLRLHPVRELLRLCYYHSVLRRFPGLFEARMGTRAVVRHLDLATSRRIPNLPELSAVYCYEGLALHTFRAAKERGLVRFYEMPTPYWRTIRRILREERAMRPEWAPTLPVDLDDLDTLQQKDAELLLADHIIVPSEFVRDSLAEAPAFPGQVHVFPYPISASVPGEASNPAPGTLRALYAGNLGQAKGLSYLDEAFHLTDAGVTLTIAGGKVNQSACPPLDAFLARHNYLGQIPNEELIRMMVDFDVLVLPTLYEGLSLALLEAMSRGLTVITTPHSGITGIVRDGREGFIVPLRNGAAIADRLNLLRSDHKRLAEMKRLARLATRRCSEERYRNNLRACLSGSMGLPGGAFS